MVNFQIGPLPGHALARKTPEGMVVFLELGTYLPARDTPPRTWKSFHFASDCLAAHNLTNHTTLDHLPYSGPDKALTAPATKRYFLQITLPGSTPDRFELLSPPLMIDGKTWPFPPIRFEYELWIGILPFNC
ncbi:hypothetical protein BJI67_11765 [Acidihalobacter aeolianus]|uniref:Uncharacterized protein n=1 Tax=Acidihalobacter aeolianus TaxID=2792603 RepID=A0A1D8K9M4_9GAMM|nr:hypothetical protein [Acidihalobacter aeolianus]AOV17645.1 hypothetical protein BJI67_11765 [Acidihalobacter aeolianus]